MRNGSRIAVVIPALNEEKSIGKVISAIPSCVDDVIVADNGSTDLTAEVARHHGARVVRASKRGYGSACLAGITALRDPDIVVFLDGDFSDNPEEMALLVDPIILGEADLVSGSRVLGRRQPGALALHARFGNWLACTLIQLFWKARYSDLGPFRAIRTSTLGFLKMQDPNYGWMVEMQIKATLAGFRIHEVPVEYRRRIGRSKISGTIKGTLWAGSKILLTIFKMAWASTFGIGGDTVSDALVPLPRSPEPRVTKARPPSMKWIGSKTYPSGNRKNPK